MALSKNIFRENNEDESDLDSTPIEPLVFVPPTVSTLSIDTLPFEKDPLDKNSWFMRFSGTFYTLISSFLFTCATFFIKQLGVDLLDALILRSAVQTTLTYLFALYKRYPLLPGTTTQKLLQILCCATGAAAFFLYFFAIRYIELSDVITLCYTRVVWAVVFSIFVYRERPSVSSLIALPLTLLGVVFVTQPSFLFASAVPSTITGNSKYRLIGLALAMINAVTQASNVLLFKQLVSTSKDIKPSVLNFQYSGAVFIFLFINQFYKRFVLHTGLSINYILSWRYLLSSIVCLVMIVVTILTQKAIKREHPAIFTLLGSADIIFALILQNIFTSKRSNFFAILGSTLVISSVIIIGISKFINERRRHKKIKLMDNETIIKDFEGLNDKC
jgi:drug/metabolite transporter (DMT)-like permease